MSRFPIDFDGLERRRAWDKVPVSLQRQVVTLEPRPRRYLLTVALVALFVFLLTQLLLWLVPMKAEAATTVAVTDCDYPAIGQPTSIVVLVNRYDQTVVVNCRADYFTRLKGETCYCRATAACSAYVLDSDSETMVACVETRLTVLGSSRSKVVKMVQVR